ncbi:hypothetical protein [Halobacillus sp. Marseille-Q1614]|uniref:hypothetical protein n=1 Tax=Halobacillus sp. Marseille-Q1614 TaxID=2709134 RepID=UPI00156EDFD8|nr:hypothetical protein [Halobacillus sp. Marseille-Q1614]
MDTVLFSLLAFVYTALFISAIKIFKSRYVVSTAFLLPVIAGLIYDNGIIASGRLIGEGTLLESLNLARFWIHAFFTPLLVLFAWKTLEQADICLVKKSWVRLSAFVLTASLVLIELLTEVFGLELEPNWEYGVLSYSSSEPSSGPPIMVLIVSFVLLATSVMIWRKQKWAWFFIGSFLMIIGSTVQLPVESGAVTNFFELILLCSLLGTAYFQGKPVIRKSSPEHRTAFPT